jgi:glycine/D-amino acid oxidase-like deaminating enzyme
VGQRVTVLDEGDVAFRASRGNFALIWVQSKRPGARALFRVDHALVKCMGGLRGRAEGTDGIDVCFQRPGGFNLSLSERELRKPPQSLQRLQDQPGMQRFDFEMLDPARVKQAIPQIGPEVAGASYSRYDGHCNSPQLFRALNAAMQQLGVAYLPEHRVDRIEYVAREFRLFTARGEIRAPKIVLAAGIDNVRLGPMVGLDVPVRPQRGQLIVTERTAPFLNYVVQTVRQTDEGGLMTGFGRKPGATRASLAGDFGAAEPRRADVPKSPLNIAWAALRS